MAPKGFSTVFLGRDVSLLEFSTAQAAKAASSSQAALTCSSTLLQIASSFFTLSCHSLDPLLADLLGLLPAFCGPPLTTGLVTGFLCHAFELDFDCTVLLELPPPKPIGCQKKSQKKVGNEWLLIPSFSSLKNVLF